MTLLSQNQVPTIISKSVDAETNMLVYTANFCLVQLQHFAKWLNLGWDTVSAKKGKRKITLIRKQVSNGRRIRHFCADERSSCWQKALTSFFRAFTNSEISSYRITYVHPNAIFRILSVMQFPFLSAGHLHFLCYHLTHYCRLESLIIYKLSEPFIKSNQIQKTRQKPQAAQSLYLTICSASTKP